MDENFKDRLFTTIKNAFPEASWNKAKTEIRINCPFCIMEGRGDKNKHMYIYTGGTDKPPMYNCFKNTDHSGILTPKALESMLELSSSNSDNAIYDELQNTIKHVSNSTRNRINRIQKYGLFNPLPKQSQLSDAKLAYINNRLGLSLSYQDLIDNKIVLNLYDVLDANSDITMVKKDGYMDLVNQYYIGFIKNTNVGMVMRNIANKEYVSKFPPSLQKRYKVVTLQGNMDYGGYYILPSVCNMYEHIKIHIAEGPFDILSVCYNLRGNDRTNNIYAAICGNKYFNIMKYFITVMGFIDIEFHVYIDNDIDDRVLPLLRNKISPLWKVYIHSNMHEGQKDMGVRKELINEYVEAL